MNDYPANWLDIAQQIKDQANWKCEHCNYTHDIPNGYMLTVHHLNMDKADCRYENLVALCQRCHLRIQATYKPGQLFFWPPEWAIKRGLA